MQQKERVLNAVVLPEFCAENKILHELIFVIFTVTANSQNLVRCKYFRQYDTL